MNKPSKPEIDYERVAEDLVEYDPNSQAFVRIKEVQRDSQAEPEYVLEGTRSGLQHLASVLIRKGRPELEQHGYPEIDEVVMDLIHHESDISLSNVICLDDNDMPEEEGKILFSALLLNTGCFVALLSIPVLWMVGLYNVVRWWLE